VKPSRSDTSITFSFTKTDGGVFSPFLQIQNTNKDEDKAVYFVVQPSNHALWPSYPLQPHPAPQSSVFFSCLGGHTKLFASQSRRRHASAWVCAHACVHRREHEPRMCGFTLSLHGRARGSAHARTSPNGKRRRAPANAAPSPARAREPRAPPGTDLPPALRGHTAPRARPGQAESSSVGMEGWKQRLQVLEPEQT